MEPIGLFYSHIPFIFWKKQEFIFSVYIRRMMHNSFKSIYRSFHISNCELCVSNFLSSSNITGKKIIWKKYKSSLLNRKAICTIWAKSQPHSVIEEYLMWGVSDGWWHNSLYMHYIDKESWNCLSETHPMLYIKE